VMVWHFRNGKCVRFQEYTDTAVLAKALTGMAAGA
jgi:ketosteroid isomerase-like protein